MSEERRALLEKAKRYLRSAKVLADEGDYDSAVSRLYYAMFYCAEAVLLEKGLQFTSHRGVISAFGQYLVKTGDLPVEMHDWLREAFDKRQRGDYVPISMLEQRDFNDLREKAEAFVQKTEQFFQGRGQL